MTEEEKCLLDSICECAIQNHFEMNKILDLNNKILKKFDDVPLGIKDLLIENEDLKHNNKILQNDIEKLKAGINNCKKKRRLEISPQPARKNKAIKQQKRSKVVILLNNI